jgi:glycosyltransferase involved in cell wall biosynthesis
MNATEKGARALSVLQVRSSAGRFGPERVIMELAEPLRAHRVEPILLALYRPPRGGPALHPWIGEARAAGLTADQLLDPGPLSVGIVRRLGRAIRESGADVLHTHDYRSNVLGGLVARRTDRAMPWVATVHLHTAATRRLKVYRALDLMLLRLADRVITVSRDQRRLLLRRGVDRRRLCLIPPAVDVDEFARRAGAPRPTRALLGFPAEVPLVTLVGRLTAQKGVDDFLAAARRIRDERGDVRFAIVGNGPQRLALEVLARELDLEDEVRFTGYRADIASVLATSDLVALPSRAEGLPVVLLEALAMGRPVVATKVGGIPDMVRDGQTGVLIEPNRPDQLADAILALLDAPEAARRLGEEGRRHVRWHCSPDRAAARLGSVYRRVVAERQ